jgi:hypothetical protein
MTSWRESHLIHQIGKRDPAVAGQRHVALGHGFPEGSAHCGRTQLVLHRKERHEKHLVVLAEWTELFHRDDSIADAKEVCQEPKRCNNQHS